VRVEDTFRALHDLTRAVRREVPRRLVAITGSMGKTTTKELLASMLERRYRTARSPGNLNNLYGFPVALLGIPDDCEWMVAEMGMSVPGELRRVSELGRPDVALFTNVRPVHLENFASLEAIAEAKAELLAGLPPGGLVVANADDPRVMGIAARHDGPVVRFGYEDEPGARPELAVAASSPRPREGAIGSRFTLRAGERAAAAELPLHGLYNVDNALAAAGCAHRLGIGLEEIVRTLAEFVPPRGTMRGEVEKLAGDVTLIDDAYNANPDAVVKALESAALLPASRRLAVLGEMLELGPEAPAFHRAVGERAADLGFARVVGVGPLARHLSDAAGSAGAVASWLPDAAAAAAWASRALATGELGAGDLVLVKGSRGVGLEAVSAALRRAAAERQGREG
ncbi:MAG: UDP-N-acetylmuramoyl-tripeptide--D-alanyl-D-alanine ligase, partial [Acidobacteria bacterium]